MFTPDRFSLGSKIAAVLQASLLISFLSLVGTSVVRGQGDASISGSVTDTTRSASPQATIRITNTETGAARTVITDDAGRYEAPLLPVGSYEVTAFKGGFNTARRNISLVLGQRASIDLTLSLAEVRQTIHVEATATAVQLTTSDVSGLVNERQVKDLPLNGRSYDQLLTLNPGVVNYTSQRAGGVGTNNSVVGNMFSASGRRPQENLYILNGVEFTSASEINNTPGGARGQLLGVEAVREFEVVTGTYGAEYGKRPGGQVNIVTASGSNQLHGSANDFLRNSALDARNFFDQAKTPQFQRNVFGGSLGGPIKKDKTFLFGNYEGFRQNLGLSNVTFVPDDNARNGVITPLGSGCPVAQQAACAAEVTALLTLWPDANGPEVPTSTGEPSGIAKSFSNPWQHMATRRNPDVGA